MMALPPLLAGPTALAAEAPPGQPIWTQVPTRIDRSQETRERIDAPARTIDDRIYVRVDSPARMVDAVTFVADDKAFRLAGIRPFERTLICRTPAGLRWACGIRSATALSGWIAGRVVGCRAVGPEETRPSGPAALPRPPIVPAACDLDKDPLALRLVREGWAEPEDPRDALLAPAAEAARRDRRGIHADGPP